MLTPAEKSGLAGLRLAGRVQRAASSVPPEQLARLIENIKSASARRRLIYQYEGTTELIRIMPYPVTVRPEQQSYVHSVSLTIINALKRFPDLYAASEAARDLLRLSPVEEQWLQECWTPAHRDNTPIYARLDAVVDFTSPMWKDSLKFLEPNLSGVGGVHLAPSCDEVVAEVVVPELTRIDPTIDLTRAPDMRDLLIQELLDHLEIIGRPRGNIALIDPKYVHDGPDEQDILAQSYALKHGVTVVHADPAELTLKNREVYYRDTRVDIAYRDYTILDLVARANQGVDINPVKTLFRENRIISSIAAELDQKSCWEVLTEPAIAQKFLTPDERQVVRRHIPWTRIISDRRTTDPMGEGVELLKFIRESQDSLVLKPNRSYGGTGVVIGPSASESEWDAALQAAVTDKERWVVQQLAVIPVYEFPVVESSGEVSMEPFHVVMGFAATRYGVGWMTRASQKQVVNVAQHGGMCGVMVGG